MKVEEAFDISIADDEAEKVRTPKALIELVQSKVATVELSICLTHRAFNWLRRYLIEHWALPRPRITPKTQLTALIPRAQRKLFLQQLSTSLGAGDLPPGLVRPKWLKLLIAALCIAIGMYFGVIFGTGIENTLVLLLLVAVASAWVAKILTNPFRSEFPAQLASVGDVALWVRRHKPDLANCAQKAWTRAEIARIVCDIVVDALNCAKNYSEDARFIEDLGLN